MLANFRELGPPQLTAELDSRNCLSWLDRGSQARPVSTWDVSTRWGKVNTDETHTTASDAAGGVDPRGGAGGQPRHPAVVGRRWKRCTRGRGSGTQQSA